LEDAYSQKSVHQDMSLVTVALGLCEDSSGKQTEDVALVGRRSFDLVNGEVREMSLGLIGNLGVCDVVLNALHLHTSLQVTVAECIRWRQVWAPNNVHPEHVQCVDCPEGRYTPAFNRTSDCLACPQNIKCPFRADPVPDEGFQVHCFLSWLSMLTTEILSPAHYW
jgi:hypothetical protein